MSQVLFNSKIAGWRQIYQLRVSRFGWNLNTQNGVSGSLV